MNKFIKAETVKLNTKLKEEFERQKKFFTKPDVLSSLTAAALIYLNQWKNIKPVSEIKNALRSNDSSKHILSYTSNQLNAVNIFAGCNIANSEDLTNYINSNNLDSTIDLSKLKSIINPSFLSDSEMVLIYSYMLYYIANITIDLFSTEFPSTYRAQYIQELLKNTYGCIKLNITNSQQTTYNALTSILNDLSKISNYISVILSFSTVYINNRLSLSKKSKTVLDDQNICNITPDSFDVSVNSTPLTLTLSCPENIDDVLVPHTPIEVKNVFSCEISENSTNIPDSTASQDIATYAVIENNTKTNFVYSVTIDSYLSTNTVIGNLGGTSIYSPVNGYVEKLNTNSIIIRDISEPTDDFLQSQIELLNSKYQRYNDVLSFLKTFYIESQYVPMLAISAVDDASTYNIYSGIYDKFSDVKSQFKSINSSYEKKIKEITGKDNIEKAANDENLNQIKDDVDKQNTIFYKQILSLGDEAVKISLITMSKSNEYELFDYYTSELGAQLNSVESPNSIETSFYDLVQEFIRKRSIIEGYNINKIESKLNEQLNKISVDPSTKNLISLSSSVYNQNKSMTDLKNWLNGLALLNDKLSASDKITNVNNAILLFKLYINYNDNVQKYNILKKESTLKTETIKEGNSIKKFVSDLWIEYNSLPSEIIQIQNSISAISSFPSYSSTTYNGYNARLYVLSDNDCVSDQMSKYGYTDIHYWIKYCSIATLVSIANPATGWSTGWITPTTIMFPIVYIPIKAIKTNYGIVVFGLSICGIYVFPWVLYANLGMTYAVPFADPTALLKNEINSLKKTISENLKTLKVETIKKLMDNYQSQINGVSLKLQTIENELKTNRSSKPVNTSSIEYINWVKNNTELSESVLNLKIKKWKLTETYQLLYEAYKTGSSLKGTSLEFTENNINAQLDKLSNLVDKLDSVLAALPIALAPSSANFGITIKNTKPIIKIADKLNDNVNQNSIDKFTQNYQLTNDNMTSTDYSSTLVDYKKYLNMLNLVSLSMIKKDPFPKYESLKLTNLPWLNFLLNDFTIIGAQTFGFPNQPPLPV